MMVLFNAFAPKDVVPKEESTHEPLIKEPPAVRNIDPALEASLHYLTAVGVGFALERDSLGTELKKTRGADVAMILADLKRHLEDYDKPTDRELRRIMHIKKQIEDCDLSEDRKALALGAFNRSLIIHRDIANYFKSVSIQGGQTI